MKVLLVGLFGLMVLIGSSAITFADEWGGYRASPGINALRTDTMNVKNDWWGFKWWDKKEWDKKEWVKKEYNHNHRGAVPIPGTLPVFGAGFASFIAWRWRRNCRK